MLQRILVCIEHKEYILLCMCIATQVLFLNAALHYRHTIVQFSFTRRFAFINVLVHEGV